LQSRYVGQPNGDILLKEPVVRAQLDAQVGRQLPRLLRNLNVASDVELIGGALAVSGNAAHQGGEEEAIVCITEVGTAPLVEAAIFSKGRISIYAKAAQYEYLMRCVKDWVTQVNSGHRDRMVQPKNVQLLAKP